MLDTKLLKRNFHSSGIQVDWPGSIRSPVGHQEMVSKRDMKFPEKKGVDILEMKKQLLGTLHCCAVSTERWFTSEKSWMEMHVVLKNQINQ